MFISELNLIGYIQIVVNNLKKLRAGNMKNASRFTREAFRQVRFIKWQDYPVVSRVLARCRYTGESGPVPRAGHANDGSARPAPGQRPQQPDRHPKPWRPNRDG